MEIAIWPLQPLKSKGREEREREKEEEGTRVSL